MKKILHLITTLPLVVFLALGLVLGVGQQANAAGCPGSPTLPGGVYGRRWNCSYFQNTYGQFPSQYNWLLISLGQTRYDGLTSNWQTVPINQTSFVNSLHDRVFDNTSQVNAARASSIVDIMLGKQGPDFGGSVANGITYARTNWTAFASLVAAYASGSYPGYSVNFNAFFDFSTVNLNGWGLYDPDPSGDLSCTTVKCYPDAVFASPFTDTTSDFAVVFYYPGGQFVIKDKCGNLTGDTGFPPVPTSPSSVSCAGFTTDVTSPDPKQGFNLTVSVRYNPSSAAASAFGPDTMSVTFNGVTKSTGSPTISGSVASLKIAVPATNATGSLPVSWSVNGPPPTVSCSDNITVADEPYFTVPNGDTQSGAPMGLNNPSGGTDCSTVPADSKAGIVSWNREFGGNFAGAGTGYAAFALNYLQDFATAQGSTAGNATQPTGLSFSNTSFTGPGGNQNVDTTGSGNDTYGGNFGLESCMPDFTAKLGTPQPNGTPVPAPNPAGQVVFYVKGNVYLNSNVAIFGGSYVKLGAIPSYSIITTGGNIYISGNVTRLDGLYVAEPDSSGNGGNIYTCTTVSSGALQNGDPSLTIDLANYYSDCKNPLTVNGAFVAKQVWLLRTSGTLYGNTSAETFNFTPEVWLSMPFDSSGTSGGTGTTYDAITSLPPTL